MLNVLFLVIGGLVGFIGSRRLRKPIRPDHAANAASVARNVSSTLGRRKGLTPPELQRACFSEMVRHVRVTRNGHTYAPSRYRILLHPDDLAVVDESRRWFTEGLTDALRQAALSNDWVLDGLIEIDYVADPTRHPGAPAALATPPEQTAGAAPTGSPIAGPAPTPRVRTASTGAAGAAGTLSVVRSDTGERIALVAETITIGRSRDRAVMVDDTRVSRTHAHIEPRQGGWAVIDDGSANGTIVNGEALPSGRPCPLLPGDVIGIGPVELSVVNEGPLSADPGTRALDNSGRNRISGEVLPPIRRPRS